MAPKKKKKKSRARKTSDKPTRVWSSRALPPENPGHRKIVDDFFLAHQYREGLCEIEIARSDRFRQGVLRTQASYLRTLTGGEI